MKAHLACCLAPALALALTLALTLGPASGLAFVFDCTHYEDYLQVAAEVYPDPELGPEGWYRDLAIKGQYAYSIVAYYYNSQELLQVIDLSDPLAPAFEGRAGLAVRNHTCLDIWDHYVYIGGPGLKIVDVDDETAPMLVGSSSVVQEVRDLVAGAGRLYATSGASQVKILNLGDPDDPGLLGTIHTPFYPYSLAVQGDRLAVGGQQGVAIYSVLNPSFPSLLGTVPLTGNAHCLAWEDDLLLAGCHDQTVLIDTGDPSSPITLGAIPISGAIAAEVQDGVAWLGVEDYGHGTLDRWDITVPAECRLLGRTRCVGLPFGLSLALGNVYTAAWADDYAWVYEAPLVVYAGQEPADPPHIGQLGISPGYNAHYASGLRGDHLYVVGTTDIDIVDLSDPTQPVLGEPVNILGYGVFGHEGLVVGPNLLVYMWDLYNDEYWWDLYSLEDPLHPVYASDPPITSAVTARGNWAYESGGDGVDVYESLPTGRLEFLGTLFPGVPAGRPVFDGDMAAFMYGNYEILLAEMTGPVQARELGRIPAPESGGWRLPLALGEGLLISLDAEAETWEIWDLADPAVPQRLFTHAAAPFLETRRCLLHRGLLYLDGRNSLEIWDLSDGAAPDKLGEWPHPSSRLQLHARADHLVTQGGNGYITTLPYQCSPASAAPGPEDLQLDPVLAMTASPNPSRGATTVALALAEAGPVEMEVYDLRGRRVAGISEPWLTAGRHQLVWNGRDADGRAAAAGVYLVRVRAGARIGHQRVVLLR